VPAAKKHASARARANRASTAATLKVVREAGGMIPAIPEGVEWHPQAVAYWNDAWTSEMSPEWLDSDYHNVVLCAFLYHDFWTAETAGQRKDAAAELRLQRKDLGLAPAPRRSLEWTIETAEQAKDAGAARRGRQAAAQPQAKDDPRLALVQ